MDQISKRRKWRWGAAVIVLIVVVCGAFGISRAQKAEPNAPQANSGPAPIPVTTMQVPRRNIDVFATGIGTVQAFQQVTIRARVTGYLAKIDFTEGQEVKPGDLLAQIDPRPYQQVLDQARAKKSADDAQLRNAQINLSRYAALAHDQFASKQQLDNQNEQVEQLKATIAGDTATVEAAELNLEYCRITSPIEGVIGLRQVDVGNLIEAASAQGIVSVAQVHPISLLFTLPQDDLPQIQSALEAGNAQVLAYSSDGKTKFSAGTLLTRNNQIEAGTGMITLKATFANTDNKLWPGEFVNARIQLRTDKNVVVVPRATVQHGPSGLYVYFVKPDSTVASKGVTVGYEDEKDAEITAGLDGGEEIVLGGQSRLQDGTKIKAEPNSKTTS